MSDVAPLGVLIDPADQANSAQQTVQCISELLYKIHQLETSLKSAKAQSNQTEQLNQKQNWKNTHQEDEISALTMKVQKLEAELDHTNKRLSDQEKESKKLLVGAKQEVNKQENKITMLKHELRKLELENEKLRQSLKVKLSLKTTNCINQNKPKALGDMQKHVNKDEFYEMIKLGFMEQMTNINSEMRQTQEYSQVITRWISDTFDVKLLRTMQIQELKQILEQIDLENYHNRNLSIRQSIRKSTYKKRIKEQRSPSIKDVGRNEPVLPINNFKHGLEEE